jgi:hypothetical protein
LIYNELHKSITHRRALFLSIKKKIKKNLIFTSEISTIEVGRAVRGRLRTKTNELKRGIAMKTKNLTLVKLLILLVLTLTVAAPQVQAAMTGADLTQAAYEVTDGTDE